VLELGLAGKRAVVAGSGPGLGRSCALGLAEAGASVACIDFEEERAQEVASEVRSKGGTAVFARADLRTAAGAKQAVASVTEMLGGVDLVVDVIGEIRWGPVVELTDADWDYSVDSVIRHFFNIVRAAGPVMIEQQMGGSIVSVSSVSAISAPFHAPYGAAKAGLMSLTRSLAIELAPDGIRVNCVAPGAVATPRVARRLADSPGAAEAQNAKAPFGRIGESDEIAKVVVFLSSDLASYVSGETIVVDGAATAQFPLGPMRPDRLPDNTTLEQPPPLQA
jgi:NAD(P)-dependent dehydrogenase (short-subunit alcohol dehydrogenase family)